MIVRSESVAPGARAALIGLVRDRERVAAVNMDPPTAAAFTIERVEELTAGEVSAHTHGRYRAPGCLLRFRNTSPRPAVFRAEVVGGPDTERLESEILDAAGDAWDRGGDRITVEDAQRLR